MTSTNAVYFSSCEDWTYLNVQIQYNDVYIQVVLTCPLLNTIQIIQVNKWNLFMCSHFYNGYSVLRKCFDPKYDTN